MERAFRGFVTVDQQVTEPRLGKKKPTKKPSSVTRGELNECLNKNLLLLCFEYFEYFLTVLLAFFLSVPVFLKAICLFSA